MEFIKQPNLAKNLLAKCKKLQEYAELQQERYEKEVKKIAELYPVDTVKPKPINYGHFRIEFDELILDVADTEKVLDELGIQQQAIFKGLVTRNNDAYTYICYTWESYYLLFPLCQNFFFVTEDKEKLISKKEVLPMLTALVMNQTRVSDRVQVQAVYKVIDNLLITMTQILWPEGTYYLSLQESKTKVRNLLCYLREEYSYDICREINHADLTNSVRLN